MSARVIRGMDWAAAFGWRGFGCCGFQMDPVMYCDQQYTVCGSARTQKHELTHMHTYIHKCINTQIHKYVHTYIIACMHTYIQTYAYMHSYVRTYVCTHTHTYLYMQNICMCNMVYHYKNAQPLLCDETKGKQKRGVCLNKSKPTKDLRLKKNKLTCVSIGDKTPERVIRR